MTDHAIARAGCHDAVSIADWMACRYRHWKARGKVRAMQDLDDRTLADIGVRRDEVLWASRLPLSVNAALELEQAAYGRRKRQRPYR
jgi:uncharacterized protein YjiS (DUF1127 family)